MSVSKKQQACVHRYVAKKYDRIELCVYKGGRSVLKNAAEMYGMSVNAYIIAAIEKALREDGLSLPEAPENETVLPKI